MLIQLAGMSDEMSAAYAATEGVTAEWEPQAQADIIPEDPTYHQDLLHSVSEAQHEEALEHPALEKGQLMTWGILTASILLPFLMVRMYKLVARWITSHAKTHALQHQPGGGSHSRASNTPRSPSSTPIRTTATAATTPVSGGSMKSAVSSPFSHEKLVRCVRSPSKATASKPQAHAAPPSTGIHSSFTVTKIERDRMKAERARQKLQEAGREQQVQGTPKRSWQGRLNLLSILSPAPSDAAKNDGRDTASQSIQDAPEEHTGWDQRLIEESNQNLSARSSLEGLQGSAQYKKWRQSHEELVGQSETLMKTYQALRWVDPDAFNALLSRRDLRNFECIQPPRVLLLIDYVACTAVTIHLLLSALQPIVTAPCGGASEATETAKGKIVMLLSWLLMQLGAYVYGFTSVLGAMMGLYAVRADSLYADHQVLATMFQMMCAAFVELTLIISTFLVGGVFSCIMMLSGYGQSLSYNAFGINAVLEVSQPMRAV